MWQPGVKLEEVERETILSALRFYHGNRTHAANSLGVPLRTLMAKLAAFKKAGIAVPPAPGGQKGEEAAGE